MGREQYFAQPEQELGSQLPDAAFGFERYEEIPEQYVRELYNNPHLQSSLNWREFAVFIDRAKREKTPKSVDAFILPRHHRAVNFFPAENLVERRKLQDGKEEEFHYTTVNSKGGGFVVPLRYNDKGESGYTTADPEIVKHKTPEYQWGYDMLGLMDGRVAWSLKRKTDQMIESGARCESIAAVFAIDAVKYKGEWTPVDVLRKQTDDEGHRIWPQTNFDEIRTRQKNARGDAEYKNYLEQLAGEGRYIGEYHPVIVVRLQRTPYRIKDFDQESSLEIRRQILDHALNVVSWEQKFRDSFFPDLSAEKLDDIAQYLCFMAESMGHNLGVLQRNGYFMQYLNSGNVSMAGELIDLDSLVSVFKNKKTKDGEDLVFDNSGLADYEGEEQYYHIPKFIFKDMRDAVLACYKVYTAVKEVLPSIGLKSVHRQKMGLKFTDSYASALKEGEGMARIVSKTSLIEVCQSIVTTRFIEGATLARTPIDE